jgi:hypothetical protein
MSVVSTIALRPRVAAKRSHETGASENDPPLGKRLRHPRWVDGIDHGCAATNATQKNAEGDETIDEIAAALSMLSKAPVPMLRPHPGVRRCPPFGQSPAPVESPNAYASTNAALEPAPSEPNDLDKLGVVFGLALRDFRAGKNAIATAVAEGAPASTIDRLERTARVLDALHRRAFENAFMLAMQVRALPPFVLERAHLLAAVVRHNRVVRPGDMGITPEFALHALRCARWVLALDAHGGACIIPSGVMPNVRVVLWDHEMQQHHSMRTIIV